MTEEIKSVKDETIDEESLPELVQWSKIGGRPTSLRDLSVSDADKLDNVPETGDFGNLAWEDVADEIHIKTGAITETKISDNSISTPKLQTGSVTSAKVTTGELITLSAQIRDAIINNAHIDNLSADKITAGTLTGRTVQTATSGKRIRLSSSPQNEIEFLDDNTLIGILEVDKVGDDGYFRLLDSEGMGLRLRLGMGASVFSSSDLGSYGGSFYTGGSMTNGSISMTAGDGSKYFRIIRSSGSYYMETDVELASHWDPYDDDTYYLGSSSKRWAGLYAMYIRSYGDARVDDNLTVYGTTSTKNLGVTNLVVFSGIPTSDPGNAGVVYRSGNDLRISTG